MREIQPIVDGLNRAKQQIQIYTLLGSIMKKKGINYKECDFHYSQMMDDWNLDIGENIREQIIDGVPH